MTTAPFRLPILALPLFPALGQGCFAGSPTVSRSKDGVETQESTSAVIVTRDPHTAVVLCWAAPRFDVVFATNGGGAGRVILSPKPGRTERLQ